MNTPILGQADAKPDDAAREDAPSLPREAMPELPPEFGGREGPEPTRYGDWEKNGRCVDF